MAEAPARVWLRQSTSDWIAADKVLDEKDASTFCQSIGKHQQAVEKSVKGILAAFREAKFLAVPTPRGHGVDLEISHIRSAVRRLARTKNTIGLLHHIENLFTHKNIAEISELCRLAPAWPGPGNLFPRNTEYPFQTASNSWIAPADTAAFPVRDVRKFRHLAGSVVERAGKIISAIERK